MLAIFLESLEQLLFDELQKCIVVFERFDSWIWIDVLCYFFDAVDDCFLEEVRNEIRRVLVEGQPVDDGVDVRSDGVEEPLGVAVLDVVDDLHLPRGVHECDRSTHFHRLVIV